MRASGLVRFVWYRERAVNSGTIDRARFALKAVIGVLTVLAMVVAGSAGAADHAITGKKLRLKTSKFALLSRDANAHTTAAPVCPAADSSLTVADGVHTQTFTLPCANWSDRGTLAMYKDAFAALGPSQLKIAKGGAGRLKVVGSGLGGFPVPNGPATISVVLDLGGTIDRYCMAFTGTGDGDDFRVRNAPAGTCPACGDPRRPVTSSSPA